MKFDLERDCGENEGDTMIPKPSPLLTPLYYEVHITVSGLERTAGTWDLGADIGEAGFRLLSGFENDGNFDGSEQIITGKAKDLNLLVERAGILIDALRAEGVVVLRNKIEAAIVDSKPMKDHKGFLDA